MTLLGLSTASIDRHLKHAPLSRRIIVMAVDPTPDAPRLFSRSSRPCASRPLPDACERLCISYPTPSFDIFQTREARAMSLQFLS